MKQFIEHWVMKTPWIRTWHLISAILVPPFTFAISMLKEILSCFRAAIHRYGCLLCAVLGSQLKGEQSWIQEQHHFLRSCTWWPHPCFTWTRVVITKPTSDYLTLNSFSSYKMRHSNNKIIYPTGLSPMRGIALLGTAWRGNSAPLLR